MKEYMNQRMSPNDLRHPKSWKKNERHSNIWIAFRSDLSLKNGKQYVTRPTIPETIERQAVEAVASPSISTCRRLVRVVQG